MPNAEEPFQGYYTEKAVIPLSLGEVQALEERAKTLDITVGALIRGCLFYRYSLKDVLHEGPSGARIHNVYIPLTQPQMYSITQTAVSRGHTDARYITDRLYE